jgi:hypothetical protein
LFKAERPPGGVEVGSFEDLYQVIGEKLKLEENGVGQKIL